MKIRITPDRVRMLHDTGAVKLADYIAAVEAAYAAHGQGAATVVPRLSLVTDTDRTSARPRSMKVAAAALPPLGVMGVVSYPAGYGRPLNFHILLHDAVSGDVLAMVEGEEVTEYATGAVTAVATRHLGRPDSTVAGQIGTGVFARLQALAVAAVCPLRELKCYSRDPVKREAFAAWAAERLPEVAVRAVDTASEAVRDSDILTTVTTAHEPVFDGALLAPGMHYNAVGMHYPKTREADTAAVARSRVVVDDLDQEFEEKGEILIPIAEGAFGRDHVLGTLGDVLAGRLQGRRTAGDITMFASGGTALEYVAVAEVLYRACMA